MYINDNYSNYKYLVEYSDNFVVLSRSSSISGSSGDPDTINVLVQYFQPSEYNFLTSYTSSDSRSFTDVSSYFSSDIDSRSDFPYIFVCSFCLVIFIIFIFNNLSKLFKKGGILGFLS